MHPAAGLASKKTTVSLHGGTYEYAGNDRYLSFFSLISPGVRCECVFRREAGQTDSCQDWNRLPKYLGHAFFRGAGARRIPRRGFGGRARLVESEHDDTRNVGRQHRLWHGDGNRSQRRNERRRREGRAGYERQAFVRFICPAERSEERRVGKECCVEWSAIR